MESNGKLGGPSCPRPPELSSPRGKDWQRVKPYYQRNSSNESTGFLSVHYCESDFTSSEAIETSQAAMCWLFKMHLSVAARIYLICLCWKLNSGYNLSVRWPAKKTLSGVIKMDVSLYIIFHISFPQRFQMTQSLEIDRMLILRLLTSAFRKVIDLYPPNMPVSKEARSVFFEEWKKLHDGPYGIYPFTIHQQSGHIINDAPDFWLWSPVAALQFRSSSAIRHLSELISVPFAGIDPKPRQFIGRHMSRPKTPIRS